MPHNKPTGDQIKAYNDKLKTLGTNDNINQLILAVSDWQDKYQSLFDDYHELEAENKRLKSALEEIYEIPVEKHTELTFKIKEIIDKALEQEN